MGIKEAMLANPQLPAEEEVGLVRRAYQPPELTEFGNVFELTNFGNEDTPDGEGGSGITV